MAEQSKSPWRALVSLIVVAVVGIGALIGAHFTQGAGFVPKLALDLEGGTQVILTPRLIEGSETTGTIDQDAMNEAINIIRQRIDASGVAEAEIATLGQDNIVVSIPGKADDQTLDLIRTSATMRLRPVLQIGAPGAIDPSLNSQSGAQSGDSATAGLTPEEYAFMVADQNGDGKLSTEPLTTPENASDPAWITEQVLYDFLLLDCTDPASLLSNSADDPALPLAACSTDGTGKYLLGPTEIEGQHVSSASSGMIYSQTGQPTGQIGVNIQFDSEGSKVFKDVSTRLYGLRDTDPVRNRFAFALDGNVITAPGMNAIIPDGGAQITGNFTVDSAKTLANQLSFGSLPLNFEVQSEQEISATLGSHHLAMGILAGIIGLILVVLWMIWQYRGLAIVSAGSLVVAAFLTYLAITILSWAIGYRLSLPGVTGLIIAVGITADSFIVYFERIRDEVRDGIPLSGAVERGWRRARRTIVISDMVNLVAATVLYVLAVGGVQGFAFTLGLTTIVDLVVIFLFTHPLMALLMRTRFFGEGHRWSGLDPEHLGAKSGTVYSGRGRVRQLEGEPTVDSGEQTIAERRRQARLAAKVEEESAE
ncbi:protein translocase subunit SecD [Scrofimicrobium sp. R131]|uniref:Protein translocase subunit SecD n=1 Tax=Scrofimicrobium appendicitidis TaxID=3079930 RepID=A0AAU7V599_9ACTO